jgi:hypothetical protein
VPLLGVEVPGTTNPIKKSGFDKAPPQANANSNVYDLALKQDESSRRRRIADLEHENALLMRVILETRIEVARLRKLLSSN